MIGEKEGSFMKKILLLTTIIMLTHGGMLMGFFQLTSSAFVDGKAIPKKFTCQGANVSPALQWSGTPVGTKSFALIMDDPDAPQGTFVHWVLFNIPATIKELKEGEMQGIGGSTSFNKKVYGGPCPPEGTHHYHFKLYALNTILLLQPGATKEQLLTAMKNHIIDQAELVGTYKKV